MCGVYILFAFLFPILNMQKSESSLSNVEKFNSIEYYKTSPFFFDSRFSILQRRVARRGGEEWGGGEGVGGVV